MPYSKLSYGLASAYLGHPVSPGKYPQSTLNIGRYPLVDLSLSLPRMSSQLSSPKDALLKRLPVCVRLAKRQRKRTPSCARFCRPLFKTRCLLFYSQSRHAVLAWETIEWALATFPELADDLQAELARQVGTAEVLLPLYESLSPLEPQCNESATLSKPHVRDIVGTLINVVSA